MPTVNAVNSGMKYIPQIWGQLSVPLHRAGLSRYQNGSNDSPNLGIVNKRSQFMAAGAKDKCAKVYFLAPPNKLMLYPN